MYIESIKAKLKMLDQIWQPAQYIFYHL
jgi:hypothetical protein